MAEPQAKRARHDVEECVCDDDPPSWCAFVAGARQRDMDAVRAFDKRLEVLRDDAERRGRLLREEHNLLVCTLERVHRFARVAFENATKKSIRADEFRPMWDAGTAHKSTHGPFANPADSTPGYGEPRTSRLDCSSRPLDTTLLEFRAVHGGPVCTNVNRAECMSALRTTTGGAGV